MGVFDSKANEAHFAQSVELEKIAANDYNLSVSSYVEAEDTREVVDIAQLNADSPRQMMRFNDALYAELNLTEASDEALIAAMAAHPALIERPIAVVGNRAAVGRPLENIEALLP